LWNRRAGSLYFTWVYRTEKASGRGFHILGHLALVATCAKHAVVDRKDRNSGLQTGLGRLDRDVAVLLHQPDALVGMESVFDRWVAPRQDIEQPRRFGPGIWPVRLVHEGRDGALSRSRVQRDIERELFATVRHRTVRTKGALSPTTARLMVFKLVMAASRTWRRLKGENQLPKVVAGVTFVDGTEVLDRTSDRAA